MRKPVISQRAHPAQRDGIRHALNRRSRHPGFSSGSRRTSAYAATSLSSATDRSSEPRGARVTAVARSTTPRGPSTAIRLLASMRRSLSASSRLREPLSSSSKSSLSRRDRPGSSLLDCASSKSPAATSSPATTVWSRMRASARRSRSQAACSRRLWVAAPNHPPSTAMAAPIAAPMIPSMRRCYARRTGAGCRPLPSHRPLRPRLLSTAAAGLLDFALASTGSAGVLARHLDRMLVGGNLAAEVGEVAVRSAHVVKGGHEAEHRGGRRPSDPRLRAHV